MIRIEHSTIGYSTPLLRIGQLNLEKGNLYVLLGKNGAGKSTFLKTLRGTVRAIDGTLSIDGKNINSIALQDRAKLVSFVSSRPSYTEYMTVEEFVGLGRTPYLNLFAQQKESDQKAIDESIAACGIEKIRSKAIDSVSDGERQLAAVAKALAHDTPYILLDEPTAYLDYSNKRKLMELLITLAKEQNKCILATSHDVELVLKSNCSLLVIEEKEQLLHQVSNAISLDELIEKVF